MASVRRIFKTKNTIHICVLLALLCLLLGNAVNLIGDIKIRKTIQEKYEVTRVLLDTISGTISNGGKVEFLQSSWAGAKSEIEIDAESFIVTLTFKNLPAGKMGTLKFLPFVLTKKSYISLGAYLKSEKIVNQNEVRWVCTSSLFKSRKEYIRDNIGSLPSEIAPDKCRYLTDTLLLQD